MICFFSPTREASLTSGPEIKYAQLSTTVQLSSSSSNLKSLNFGIFEDMQESTLHFGGPVSLPKPVNCYAMLLKNGEISM